MNLPYAGTSSGTKAREEILKILKRFGCTSVGFMDEFDTGSVMLAFVWRERQIQLRASSRGWASAYLRENPWSAKRHSTREEWEQRALDQGMIAVNSILRDWVKGQVTAIETGILSFEHIFLPYMLAADGRPLIEQAKQLLLAPTGGKTT